MRHNYLPLWILLSVAFAVIAAISFFGPVNIMGYQLRDSGLSELFSPMQTPQPQPDEALLAAIGDSIAADTATMAPVDTLPKTILFVGDSMLDGLYPRLAAYARHNGHKLYAVIWYSSTSEIWGRSGKLASYIQRLKPDYVFLCLGANELFVKDIERKRDKYVGKIISEIGDIPYLWIGPPNWKPDTGINRLIASHASPGSFFLSDGMSFERSKDGAHPTKASSVQWMDSIVRWMPAHSPHPIRLELPDRATDRATRVFVHQPGEN